MQNYPARPAISRSYTYILNAATRLNQSKNAFQAEINATCELADFLCFNVKFMEQIYAEQPNSDKGVWNRLEYRPLEGFIFALSPFNFTAIAGNLSTAPALMGNTIVWKPSSTSVLSGYYLMKIFKEAGLPDGVINFIPGQGSKTGENITKYKSYPRIVGETGGKDYIFMHKSANADEVVTAAIRGSFSIRDRSVLQPPDFISRNQDGMKYQKVF